MADDPWSPSERYERTYSRNLDDALQALKAASTTNDYAIACALSELSRVQEDEAAAQAPRPDTSYDEQLALSLHEREANKLLTQPSRNKRLRRRDRALRSLLRHLQPTQVVPRLNPTVEPSAAWVSEDRQRLLLRLDMYGLQERPVKGDGNCQFRALADQLFYDQERHAEVRQAVVDQLCCYGERYRDYCAMDYKAYVSDMSRLGTWGDHITLQAAADTYGVGVCLITSFLENSVIGITPVPPESARAGAAESLAAQQAAALREQQAAAVSSTQEEGMQALQQAPHADAPQAKSQLTDAGITLWLAFWAELHYNSIAPKAAADGSESAGSSSNEEDEAAGPGRSKLLGSVRLHRLVKQVL